MKYMIIALSLVLAGCNTTTQIRYETLVVTPPEALLDQKNCPAPPKKPNPEALTNKQIADYIKSVYSNNRLCYINLNNLREFIRQAEAASASE